MPSYLSVVLDSFFEKTIGKGKHTIEHGLKKSAFKLWEEIVLFYFKIHLNKAGYTATSCGRVSRGGNARFPTFQLKHYGPTNQQTNQPTNQQTDGQSGVQSQLASD